MADGTYLNIQSVVTKELRKVENFSNLKIKTISEKSGYSSRTVSRHLETIKLNINLSFFTKNKKTIEIISDAFKELLKYKDIDNIQKNDIENITGLSKRTMDRYFDQAKSNIFSDIKKSIESYLLKNLTNNRIDYRTVSDKTGYSVKFVKTIALQLFGEDKHLRKKYIQMKYRVERYKKNIDEVETIVRNIIRSHYFIQDLYGDSKFIPTEKMLAEYSLLDIKTIKKYNAVAIGRLTEMKIRSERKSTIFMKKF
jgi:AraC-like DNA-binding protein